jgi:hypothetical protein
MQGVFTLTDSYFKLAILICLVYCSEAASVAALCVSCVYVYVCEGGVQGHGPLQYA